MRCEVDSQLFTTEQSAAQLTAYQNYSFTRISNYICDQEVMSHNALLFSYSYELSIIENEASKFPYNNFNSN